MSRLSLKTLKLKKLPHGRYTFKVQLARTANRVSSASSNAGNVQQMRDMMRTTCVGEYRFKHEFNWNKKRVYTELFLTNAMDLAMLKLVHHEKIHKIYKIRLIEPVE